MNEAAPSPETRAASPHGRAAETALSIALVLGSVSHRGGGLFNSVRASALALYAQGHDVRVFSIVDEATEQDLPAWAPLRPEVLPFVGPRALGYAPGLGSMLRQGRFDVVHQHGIWQAFSVTVSRWRRSGSGPVMISPRGMLDGWALANSKEKKVVAATLWERANLSGATCLHALNAAEADAMRAYGLTNPIAVIPNGTDIDDTPAPPPAPWWPMGRKVLLFLGRLHPKKGLAELIEAWRLVRNRNPALARQWHLVVAGWDDGGHLDKLRVAIAEAGLEDAVTLPGILLGEAKRAAYAHADAFVLPSYSEGLPMSVLEAWATGLPVLMTEACNLPEGFVEKAAMRISNAPGQLAEDLATALASPTLPATGAAGRRLVRERFGWDGIARRHVAVYRWMANGAPREAAPACICHES